jgi:diguanylate cyclase (GGDEF)-like protein
MDPQSPWLETKDGLVSFSRLRPGKHLLQVMICNSVLNRCSMPAAVLLDVAPAWWHSYFFYAGCSGLLILIVAGGIWLNSLRMRRRSQELEVLVRERTTELEKSQNLLELQATYDNLTGLLNRGRILKALEEEIEAAKNPSTKLLVGLADLDHFKRINDELGHLAGDHALRCFAQAASSALRAQDRVGRYGGEEFLFVLRLARADEPEGIIQRLHKSVSNLQLDFEATELNLTCSIGAIVTDAEVKNCSANLLLGAADKALYRAKVLGRNRVVLYRSLKEADCLIEKTQKL